MIHEILLNECLSPSAPPERVLRLKVIGDTVFVEICRYTEDVGSSSLTQETRDIAVDVSSLKKALALMQDDEQRQSMRGPDGSHGERAVSYQGGARHVISPL